jgi:hypothetical protein
VAEAMDTARLAEVSEAFFMSRAFRRRTDGRIVGSIRSMPCGSSG